jgi:CHAD domain-containing protein
MGFELAEGESFSDGVKRIVLEQINEALLNLKPTARSKDKAVHDARVCIKKVRAVLRLIKKSLGNKIYKAEDKAYRDAARTLSKVRDSAAMLEVIDNLAHHFSDQLSRNAFEDVRALLIRSKKVRQVDRNKTMSQAARALRQARKRVQDWPRIDRRESLSVGLKRVFMRGRNNFAAAYDDPGVETFHEWRKQVKHLLYQSRLLRPLWLRAMKSLRAELKTLGGYLSEDHDLAILRDRALKQLEDSQDQTEIEALIALIDKRRSELQLRARTLGDRIYFEKPRQFAARTEAYWKAWRSEAKIDPIAARPADI